MTSSESCWIAARWTSTSASIKNVRTITWTKVETTLHDSCLRSSLPMRRLFEDVKFRIRLPKTNSVIDKTYRRQRGSSTRGSSHSARMKVIRPNDNHCTGPSLPAAFRGGLLEREDPTAVLLISSLRTACRSPSSLVQSEPALLPPLPELDFSNRDLGRAECRWCSRPLRSGGERRTPATLCP